MFSCNKVITIPQYYGTCWFNAILMAILYSQYSRKLLLHTFEKKKDKFSRIMDDIIKHNYIKTKNAIKYFKFMRPENILKYMEHSNFLIENFKKNQGYSYEMDIFLPFFIKSLGKKVLDIIIYDNNMYANFYSIIPYIEIAFHKYVKTKNIDFDLSKWDKIDEDPDYIVVNPIPMLGISTPYEKAFFNINLKDKSVLNPINLKTHNISIDGLLNFDDNIFYNNNKYILDSILLENYNDVKLNIRHAIAGITCKNDRYIYNGWMRTTDDPGNIDKINMHSLPCELMKFDWDVKKNIKFCLNNRLCKITEILDEKQVCFSFNRQDKITLIYVKDNSYKSSIDFNIPISSSLTLPSLKSNSSNYSNIYDLNVIAGIKYKIERKKRKKEQEKFKKIVKKEPKKTLEELLKEPKKKPKEPKKKLEELLKEPKKKPKEPKKKPKEPKKTLEELLKEPKKKPKESKKRLEEPKKRLEELLKEPKKKPKEPKKRLEEPNKNIKDCDKYKILNPKTNRCVSIDGKIGKLLKLKNEFNYINK